MSRRFLHTVGVRLRIVDDPGSVILEPDPIDPAARHIFEHLQGFFPGNSAGAPAGVAERCRVEGAILIQFSDKADSAAGQLFGNFQRYARHLFLGIAGHALPEDSDDRCQQGGLALNLLILPSAFGQLFFQLGIVAAAFYGHVSPLAYGNPEGFPSDLHCLSR